MKKNFEDFYIGFDIGTESVGWAVTDLDYKPLRLNNKPGMGVRLFSAAQAAQGRRLARGSRRRLFRRKLRLNLLKEIFAEAVNAKDVNFFARLEDSNLYDGDKREKTKFSLFSDPDFNDKDFYDKYPTVYHLRKAMMTAQNPDPREVYLAIHHIIKYRGHFLQEGESMSAIDDITAPLQAINDFYESAADADLQTLDLSKTDDFRNLLILNEGVKQKADKFVQLFDVKQYAHLKALLELIAGHSTALGKLYNKKGDEEFSKIKVDFKSFSEENESNLRSLLSADYVLIENARLLYDYSCLKKLLGDRKYISDAMVEKYQKHKSDLAALKKVIRQNFGQDVYRDMFGSSQKANYTAYVNKVKFGKRIFDIKKAADSEEFYKYVKDVLTSSPQTAESPEAAKILYDIENGTFMPKQVSKANAVLPYQINAVELDAILTNAAQYDGFAFLNEKDESGYDGITKIKSLLTFRMPYFVGPLNNHSGKYWAERLQDGTVYPWNYQTKIDLAQSEEKFILRMTNNCPYIPGESVLPKCSLLYEEYSLLNIINKIRVEGCLLSVDQKNSLSTYFSENGIKSMSEKVFRKWLAEQGLVTKSDAASVRIDGFDDEIAANRKTYYHFSKILGGSENVEKYRSEIEKIILWATVAGPEKSNLKRCLKANCTFLDDRQIKEIAGLTLKGWGRFSEKFLTARLGADLQTGEAAVVSVMDMLRGTNCNLSEILGNDYTFRSALEEMREEKFTVTYEDVDELYCSPAVKKQIWQTIRVAKELKKVTGKDPKKIFIEMARGVDPQKARRDEMNRSISRRKQLTDIYHKLAKEKESLYGETSNELDKLDVKALQNNKLYLYFLQNGVDVYTGERIDYNNLSAYDKDHIYPRSKIKDDSILNNLVLTYHENNVRKTDIYPLPQEVRRKMLPLWRALLEKGLMTRQKFDRLTRSTPLTGEECEQFINRQITETQQSTKEAAALIQRIFPASEIVYSKAGNVTDFRKGDYTRKPFVKVREINDLHHAKDAYLNIVVGNVWNTKFGHNATFWMKDNNKDHYNLLKLFDERVESKGVVAWEPGAEGTMRRVEQTMRSSAVLFTRKPFIQKGQLFNATIQKKRDEPLIPLKCTQKDTRLSKMANTQKYGGYTSETRSYFMLVKNTQKKKQRYTLLGVTAKDLGKVKDDAGRLEYCRNCGLIDSEVIVPCIKIDTLFSINGTPMFLSGMTGKQILWNLAVQNSFDEEGEKYIKKVVVINEKHKKNSEIKAGEKDGISAELNGVLYDEIVSKLSSDRYKGASSLKNLVITLRKKREVFDSLALTEQCLVLEQMLKALQCNSRWSDLSLLGEGKSCGILYTSNTFDSLENVQIVYRSVTGIYERKQSFK